MTTPEERIRELARAQAIDTNDAGELLDAVKHRRPGAPDDGHAARRKRSWLHPFERYSGEVTSAVGALTALVAMGTSQLGVRYDGALDLHATNVPVTFWTALVDQLVAFPLTAAVFFAIARAVTRGVRFIDVLGFVGAARVPLVVAAVPIALLAPATLTSGPPEMTPRVLTLALLALAAIALHITLLVLGVRTVTGARGLTLAGTVALSIVVAEVVSKLALAVLL